MSSRVLVTGAAGFIASHLSERLLKKGISVVGLDSFDDFYDPAIKRGNLDGIRRAGDFVFHQGDIRNRPLMSSNYSSWHASTI